MLMSRMTTRRTAALAGAVLGLGALAATAIPSFAQQTPTPQSASQGVPTHEQMDQMMEAMGGAGTSQRMHEAMGGGDAAAGEQLMEQCVQMMGMMQQMQGMMGSSGMSAMRGMPGMGGMMGGQPSSRGSGQ